MAGKWPIKGVDPRPGQVEAFQKLTQLLIEHSKVVLSAPTGWGKTLTIIAALMATRMFPALWLVRSLSIGFRIAEDAAKAGLRTIIAAGRNRMCILAKRRDLADEVCRLKKLNCRFFRGLFENIVNPLDNRLTVDWMTIRRMGEDMGFCPYYAQDIFDCDIVVQNYNRRRGRIFRIFVVDEAHNLWLPKEVRIHVSVLDDVEVMLERYPFTEKYTLEKIRRIKRRALDYGGGVINSTFDEEDLNAMKAALIYSIENGAPEGLLVELKNFIRLARCKVIYLEGEYLKGIKHFNPFVPSPFIMASGTWINELNKLIGDVRVVEVPPVRRPAYVLDWVTSRYGEETIDEYGRLLFTLRKYFRKIVVFGADRILRYFKNRCDYYEPEKVEGLEGLILLRARGRFSEGVDIPCDCIVMLGCPFMPPEIIGRLESIYRKAGFSNPWMLAAEIPMLITTLQCIGRATRTPDAKPLILLADSRYKRYRNTLSKYLYLEEVNGLDALNRILSCMS